MAKGGCLCGKVRFATDGDPKWVSHCHCFSCRRHTGSAVATFVGFARSQVTFETPARSVYSSSPGVFRSFCNHCGTPIAYEAESAEGELHLYVCTFDEPEQFVPRSHVFFAEHLPWLELHDDLPRFEGSGGGTPVAFGPTK